MKQYLKILIYLLVICVVSFSCDSKSEDELPFLIVEMDELTQTFTSDSKSKEISVFANRLVEASIVPVEASEWCELSVTPGTLNETSLRISVKRMKLKINDKHPLCY